MVDKKFYYIIFISIIFISFFYSYTLPSIILNKFTYFGPILGAFFSIFITVIFNLNLSFNRNTMLFFLISLFFGNIIISQALIYMDTKLLIRGITHILLISSALVLSKFFNLKTFEKAIFLVLVLFIIIGLIPLLEGDLKTITLKTGEVLLIKESFIFTNRIEAGAWLPRLSFGTFHPNEIAFLFELWGLLYFFNRFFTKKKYSLVLFLIITIVGFLIWESRASFIFGVSTLIFFFLKYKSKNIFRNIIIILIIVLSFLTMIVIYIKSNSIVETDFSSGRLSLWKAILEEFSHIEISKEFFGIGFSNSGKFLSSMGYMHNPHNSYIGIVVEMGFLGYTYILFIMILILFLYFKSKGEKILISSLILGLLLYNNFEFLLFQNTFHTFLLYFLLFSWFEIHKYPRIGKF